MADTPQNSSGTVIRGADGELYFLRDELLQAAKVTEPEMKKFLEEAANTHFQKNPNSFNVQLGKIDKAVPLAGPFQKPDLNIAASSTIMCPGVMKSSAVKINPVPDKTKRF